MNSVIDQKPEIHRSHIVGILLALAIPLTIAVWWLGLITYTLMDGDMADLNLHIGYDGLDWKMNHKQKEK